MVEFGADEPTHVEQTVRRHYSHIVCCSDNQTYMILGVTTDEKVIMKLMFPWTRRDLPLERTVSVDEFNQQIDDYVPGDLWPKRGFMNLHQAKIPKKMESKK